MPDVPILRQMGRSNRLSAGNYHLVKRTALLEFGIAIPAEFTNPARSGIEAYDDTALNMFHEEGSPGAAKTDAPGFRLVHCSLRRFDDLLMIIRTTPLYYKARRLYKVCLEQNFSLFATAQFYMEVVVSAPYTTYCNFLPVISATISQYDKPLDRLKHLGFRRFACTLRQSILKSSSSLM
jgi:hypothetical protein